MVAVAGRRYLLEDRHTSPPPTAPAVKMSQVAIPSNLPPVGCAVARIKRKILPTTERQNKFSELQYEQTERGLDSYLPTPTHICIVNKLYFIEPNSLVMWLHLSLTFLPKENGVSAKSELHLVLLSTEQLLGVVSFNFIEAVWSWS